MGFLLIEFDRLRFDRRLCVLADVVTQRSLGVGKLGNHRVSASLVRHGRRELTDAGWRSGHFIRGYRYRRGPGS